MAFVTDSNRPQPVWQPPPNARLTASGAASDVPSLLMRPPPTPTRAKQLDRGPPAQGTGTATHFFGRRVPRRPRRVADPVSAVPLAWPFHRRQSVSPEDSLRIGEPTPPPPPDQRDHRGKGGNFQSGKSGRAIFWCTNPPSPPPLPTPPVRHRPAQPTTCAASNGHTQTRPRWPRRCGAMPPDRAGPGASPDPRGGGVGPARSRPRRKGVVGDPVRRGGAGTGALVPGNGPGPLPLPPPTFERRLSDTAGGGGGQTCIGMANNCRRRR